MRSAKRAKLEFDSYSQNDLNSKLEELEDKISDKENFTMEVRVPNRKIKTSSLILLLELLYTDKSFSKLAILNLY